MAFSFCRNTPCQKKYCCVIAHGVPTIALPAGVYRYNGKKYQSKHGTARYLDGTLIGAAISRNHIVKQSVEFTCCSLAEAFHTATLNPAKRKNRLPKIAHLNKDNEISDFSITIAFHTAFLCGWRVVKHKII